MTRAQPRKHKLTDAFVRNLQPEEKAFLVWDTTQQGFAVQTQPTGTQAWYAIYKFDKRKTDYKIANVKAINTEDARRLAGRVMYQVSEGKNPAAERQANRDAGTFKELAASYAKYTETEKKINLGDRPMLWFANTFCRHGAFLRLTASHARTSRRSSKASAHRR